MDANKMAAWANSGKGAKGGEEPEDLDEMEAADGDEEHAEQEQDEESGRDLGELFAALESHADEVEEAADSIDVDAAADEDELADDEAALMADTLSGLDRKLLKVLKKFSGLSREDAMTAAEHLAEEELVADPERVAAWLFHAVQHA